MNDHMDTFFRFKDRIDIEESLEKHKYELGYGLNIVGNAYGSYSQYMNLSQNIDEMFLSNYKIPIEKINNLSEDDTKDLIKNIQLSETDKFKSGEIPKLLIMFHNILNNRRIYVNWVKVDNYVKNAINKSKQSEDVILEQYYEIESAYSKNYSWWDSYSLLFIGPEEDLKPGHYYVNTKSIDVKAVKEEKDNNFHIDNYKLSFVVN